MTPEEKKTKMCFDPRLNASEKDIPWDNFSLPGNLSSYVHLKFTFQKAFELYFKLIRTAFYLLLWRIGFKDEHHVILSIDWSRERSKEDLNWAQNLTPSLNWIHHIFTWNKKPNIFVTIVFSTGFFRLLLPYCWLSHLVLLASWTPNHHLSRQEMERLLVQQSKSYTQSVRSLAVCNIPYL